MRALRWAGACLLGLLGGLLGLVGVVLCVTVLLAPLGIPVLFLARRLFRTAGQLVVPRRVRHPVEALQNAASSAAEDLGDAGRKRGRRARRKVAKTAKKAKKRAPSLS